MWEEYFKQIHVQRPCGSSEQAKNKEKAGHAGGETGEMGRALVIRIRNPSAS